MSRTEYVIGLGSNLGERTKSLDEALRAFTPLATVVTVSSLYETDPVGPPQPRYLNAAARVTTALGPLALLEELLAIERRLGRTRRERWGARTIDLDILWSPGAVVRTAELTIPHPELKRRQFALVPLLDVAPDASDPETGEPYRLCLERLSEQGVSPVVEGQSRFWTQHVRVR